MTNIFIRLLNMGLTAGWLILAVLLLRLLFAKAPKVYRMCLWGMVALRLLIPVSLESVFSLIPSTEPIPQQITTMQPPQIHTGINGFNSYVNPILGEQFRPIQSPEQLTPVPEPNALAAVAEYASVIWFFGTVLLLLYAFVSYLRLHRILREAVLYEKGVWLCDHIDTPFLIGIFRPRIILPSDLEVAEYAPVLAHEYAHIRRFDHIWKPLGFVLLAVYWFHPLIWLAYILLCRDIELACDERVVKVLDTEQTKAYTKALLHCSAPRKLLSACPLAFGEISVSARIKNALYYKKPAFWVTALAVIVCIVTAVCFLTDPPAETDRSIYSAEISFSESPTCEITAQTYQTDCLFANGEAAEDLQ